VSTVKFQKRNNRELLTEEQYNAPHPMLIIYVGIPMVRIGSSEFDVDQHAELKAYQSIGMVYSYCGIQHLQKKSITP
jgi:N-acetylneuraminate synthase